MPDEYKMTPEERVKEHIRMREKALHDQASMLTSAERKGFVKGFTETFTKAYINGLEDIVTESFAESLKKSLEKSFAETFGTKMKGYEEEMLSGMRLAGISEEQIEATRKAMLNADDQDVRSI